MFVKVRIKSKDETIKRLDRMAELISELRRLMGEFGENPNTELEIGDGENETALELFRY